MPEAPKQQPDKPLEDGSVPTPQQPMPDHTPHNSYGSHQPSKLVSGARPFLFVLFIIALIAAIVIGLLILFQE